MSPKSSTISLTVLSVILAILLLGLGAYTYYDYKQDVLDYQDLVKEKSAMEEELAQLVEKYENVQVLNSVMDNHLIESKKRIVRLLDTIRSNKPKLQLLIKFRHEMEILKNEKIQLFQLNDSILRENQKIKIDLNAKSIALSKSKDLREMLVSENQKLSSIVSKNKELAFANLKGEAMRLKGNGKQIPTDKSKKTDLLKICFTIMDNPYSLNETKSFYLKVYNPNNDLLGDPVRGRFKGESYIYSSKLSLFYRNEQINSCTSIPAKEGKIISGKYIVELYSEHVLKKTAIFSLN